MQKQILGSFLIFYSDFLVFTDFVLLVVFLVLLGLALDFFLPVVELVFLDDFEVDFLDFEADLDLVDFLDSLFSSKCLIKHLNLL